MPIFGGKKEAPKSPASPVVASQSQNSNKDFSFEDSGSQTNANVDEPFERKMLMNKEPSKWSVSEVGQWLGFLGLGEHRIPFIQNSISGLVLCD